MTDAERQKVRDALRTKAIENRDKGHHDAPLLSVNDAVAVLESLGVTLPPARVTPLEAALRNVLATWDSWDAAERKRYSDEVWRERLAACRAFEDAVASARAALLARLTEGGA